MLAALVTLLVVNNDADRGGEVAAGTTTTAASSTTTSMSTTTTTAPEPSTTTGAPTTSTALPPTTAAPMPAVTGQGAVLQKVSEAKVLPAGAGCEALADSGWTATCATVGAKGVVLAWLIETRSLSGGGTARRALVVRRDTPTQWMVVLRANDDTGSLYVGVKARAEDVSGDGASEIAFGFTRTGPSAVLSVDLVEGPGTVVVHRDLTRGSARVSSGQLDTWRRADSSRFAHEVIQERNGAWYIVGSAVVPPNEVPPSQL